MEYFVFIHVCSFDVSHGASTANGQLNTIKKKKSVQNQNKQKFPNETFLMDLVTEDVREVECE